MRGKPYANACRSYLYALPDKNFLISRWGVEFGRKMAGLAHGVARGDGLRTFSGGLRGAGAVRILYCCRESRGGLVRVERAKGKSLETAMPAWWVVLRGGGVRGCGGGSWR